jgi:hypothetical protein
MKKAITLALTTPRVELSAWWLLAVEAALAALLLMSDSVPSAAIRGLQLFLRF